MTTKPGNRTALIPQASRTALPNQNGHHASPAMSAHSSARSVLAALLAGSRPFRDLPPSTQACNLGPPEVEPAMPATAHRPSYESLPNPADGFDHRNDALDFRHATTPWVKTAFLPANTVLIPRSGEKGSPIRSPRFLLKLWPPPMWGRKATQS